VVLQMGLGLLVLALRRVGLLRLLLPLGPHGRALASGPLDPQLVGLVLAAVAAAGLAAAVR
jgi:hypothetical protein